MDLSLPGSSIHGFSRQEYWSGVPLPSPRYADDITLMAESEEELKSLLTKVKKEIEKAGLKLNIQKNRKNSSHLKYHPLERSSEKAMAPHSSTVAWKIPWMEEPGTLQRVGHD